jgi:hypothetical protein
MTSVLTEKNIKYFNKHFSVLERIGNEIGENETRLIVCDDEISGSTRELLDDICLIEGWEFQYSSDHEVLLDYITDPDRQDDEENTRIREMLAGRDLIVQQITNLRNQYAYFEEEYQQYLQKHNLFDCLQNRHNTSTADLNIMTGNQYNFKDDPEIDLPYKGYTLK